MSDKLKILDLFSGIGGFSLGLERAGMETVCFCEIDPFCQKVLNKHWPDVPIFSDVMEVSRESLTKKRIGPVDVVCGGFPCQDLSQAGKQIGINGGRSGLYSEMLRIISECLPSFAVFENVTNLIAGEDGRWFAQFLYDLAAVGYDAEWHCIPSSAFGEASHRDRVWIIAYPNGSNEQGLDFSKSLFSYSEESRRRKLARAIHATIPADDYARLRKGYHGVPEVMEQLKSYGNSVAPIIPEVIGHAIQKSRKNS